MNAEKILILFFAAIFFCTPGHAAAKISRKPLPPLQIAIVPDTAGQIRPGDTVGVKVVAVSSLDADELSLTVDLGGKVKLISGDTAWTGSVRKGEQKVLRLTVQVPEQGSARIRVRASLPPSQGARFSVDANYDLLPDVARKPYPAPSTKKDSKGRDIVEYH